MNPHFSVIFLILTSCAQLNRPSSSEVKGGASTGGGDSSLLFSCQSLPNADTNLRILVIEPQPLEADTAILQNVMGSPTFQKAHVRVTPPGADEKHTYTYKGVSDLLVVTIEPDLKPKADKIYPARWNNQEDLKCKASGTSESPSGN